MFVTTCAEKWAVIERINRELARLKPRPPALTVRRGDRAFPLHAVLPEPGLEFDLVLAVQPYRARQPAEQKVKNVLGPLAEPRCLATDQ